MRKSRQAAHRPARLLAVIAVAVAAAVMAGCSMTGPASPVATFKRGPAVTLRLAVYGMPGYRQAGLLASYEQLHPGVRIVEARTAQESSYLSSLTRALAAGGQPGDVVAIPSGEMPAVLAHYASRFVPLSTLSGAAGAASTFQASELPWIWQAAHWSGQDYAIGAESGPLALCYRPSLLREAGLPYRAAQLTRGWRTWGAYLASGRVFARRIPHGPAFMDSVTSLYNAMVSQAPLQYYSSAARLAVAGNPAVRQAWQAAASAAADGLSARLTPLTGAWDRGVVRLSFATAVCPAWMLSTLQQLSGTRGAGTWAVIPVPGGTGAWGGFYLAIPRSSRHQQDAYQLATYLTGQQAGPALTRAGTFPAGSPAINAASRVTSPYFGGAPVGRIYGLAADRVPAAPAGPAAPAISAAMDAALARVEAKTPAAAAWAHALRQAAAAFRAPGK